MLMVVVESMWPAIVILMDITYIHTTGEQNSQFPICSKIANLGEEQELMLYASSLCVVIDHQSLITPGPGHLNRTRTPTPSLTDEVFLLQRFKKKTDNLIPLGLIQDILCLVRLKNKMEKRLEKVKRMK